MNPDSALTHLPPLGGHTHDEVGRELQATLVELLDLALIGKQLHWSVIGPMFRPLHMELDKLVESWREMADTVAERGVAIGAWPDGQAEAIVSGRNLPQVTRGPVEDHDVVRQLARRIADTDERIRVRMDRMGDLDVASQDVLVGVVRVLEKQLWMVRAQLMRATG